MSSKLPSSRQAKELIMKSLTVNQSHFFSRFICRSLALVLVFTATVQAADKTTVTSAERVPNRIGIIGGRMVADMAEYGYFETALTALWTDQDITFRNLGWSRRVREKREGDRPTHYATLPQADETVDVQVEVPGVRRNYETYDNNVGSTNGFDHRRHCAG